MIHSSQRAGQVGETQSSSRPANNRPAWFILLLRHSGEATGVCRGQGLTPEARSLSRHSRNQSPRWVLRLLWFVFKSRFCNNCRSCSLGHILLLLGFLIKLGFSLRPTLSFCPTSQTQTLAPTGAKLSQTEPGQRGSHPG